MYKRQNVRREDEESIDMGRIIEECEKRIEHLEAVINKLLEKDKGE